MTTQLEAFEKRMNAKILSSKIGKKEIKAKVKNLKKIAILFRACGTLWDFQAKQLESNL